ncbi:MAG: HAMP domain-containing protein [Candidatus Sedimenticola sp. PURPLELP]
MGIFHRIKTKLAFAFLAVALIPAAIIGSYSISVSTETLLDKELSSQADKLAHIKNLVQNFLSSARGDALILSRSPLLKELLNLKFTSRSGVLLDATKQAVTDEFLAFSEQRKIYYQIRYLDETGQEVIRVDFNGRKATARPDNLLQNKGDRYYFTRAVKLPAGQVFISPLDLNRENGKIETPHKPVIRYAVPLKYADGSRAGLVLTNIDANQFLKEIKGIMLTDEEGYYLAHPDFSKEWGSSRDLASGFSFQKEFAHINRQMIGTEGTIETKSEILTFQEMTIPGTSRIWKIISTEDIDRVLRNIGEFQQRFWYILAGSLLVALVFALYLDHKISRPIEKLTLEANKVSTGNLNSPVKTGDKGEIGQLAEAFERMRLSMIKAIEITRRKRQ